ncbi:hypothetical protein FKW77_009027 [Venturia effusa]|uniref:Uncharacterized protein n=1 Tax=Venturia effusa TaxID=50376 RepID=A0A517KX55_9PEZI|nr:hypothetical protein FKW77_009027 [Venturia effusa]
MVLGVVSPDFIKRSTSQPDQQHDTRNLRSPSTSQSKVPTEQLVIPKHRNFSKPFGTSAGDRRTQSESLPTSTTANGIGGSEDTSPSRLEGDQDVTCKTDPARRSHSCSLPQPQSQLHSSDDDEGEENEMARARSTSLGETIKERLKVDDRARTWGGVPSTEMTVSGRTFLRSVLGGSARVRERSG